jgi:hypothetical protein
MMTQDLSVEPLSPDADMSIRSIKDLHDHLHAAMQLEHATIPPYLTALNSIRKDTNFDAWQILRVVVVEEMLHLAFAGNLLNAVGGEPDLTVDGFVPKYPAYLPDGEHDFKVHRAPFSKKTIDNFLRIERPKMAGGEKPKLVPHSHVAGRTYLGVHPRHPSWRYYSIGEFYAAIEDGIVRLERQARQRGGTIFTGVRERQIPGEHYFSGGGKLHPVIDEESACRAIRLIIEQGEGETNEIYGSSGELAHYYRFDQLNYQRYYEPGDTAGHPRGARFEKDIDWNDVLPVKKDVSIADMVQDPELLGMAEEFNAEYAAFLGYLTEAFNGKPDLFADGSTRMFLMRNAIGALVNLRLPGGDKHAGPTFEI